MSVSGRFWMAGTTPLFEGAVQPLSTLTFSLTGTSTAQDTYSNAGLTSANSNPVVADANGYFSDGIYLKRDRYKVIWKNAAGTTLRTFDPVDKEIVFTRGAGLPSDPSPGHVHANTSDGKTYEYKMNSAAWTDLGTTDTAANTASVTEVLAGTEAAKYVTPDSAAALWQRGTNITPSAGSVALPSTGGRVFNIAAGNFAAISSAQGGREVVFVFGGTSVITHHATSMILPGGADLTSEAGDVAAFVNEAAADASGSNWRCIWYQRDGTTLAPPIDYAATQAEQEAASSNIRWVTPGRQQYHPSAAKAWAAFTVAASLSSSYNVTSITDNGTGDFTVNFTTAFSNALYACVGTPLLSATTAHTVFYASRSTSAVDAKTQNGGTLGESNVATLGCAFFGDQ